MIIPHRGKRLKISGTIFIAPTAAIIGDVYMGPESSVWFNAVLRGDMAQIHIDARSNIQDGTVIHVADGGQGTWVGRNVTVGHAAILLEDTACTAPATAPGRRPACTAPRPAAR